LRTYTPHHEKIQVVQWNPQESTILLTGSFDRTTAVFDSRMSKAIQYYTLNAEIEHARWNPHDAHYFLASSEDGVVSCFDTRITKSRSVFILQAHDKAVSALDFNPSAKDIILTGSTDKLLKLWDIKDQKPSLLLSRSMNIVSPGEKRRRERRREKFQNMFICVLLF
jgi:periodic tryptophan protein 1